MSAAALLGSTAFPGAATAQIVGAPANSEPGETNLLAEIIVTARKIEEPAQGVGMSITSADAALLRNLGIDSVADLPRLVPGLSIQDSAYNSTSLTLRGVGFFNSDLATTPAVTLYLDEAPLSFPAMTKLAAFDLERVEVLKGPQGTMFGQNSTGGAINYITAKPTDVPRAGVDVQFGRFDRLRLGGYLSGPLGKGFSLRLAVQGARGNAWQTSISRPGDRLGRLRELQARATLAWRRGDRISSRLTFSYTEDGSDTAAAQFVAPAVRFPALAAPGLLTFPVITRPRAADWTPSRDDTGEAFPYASDTSLRHVTWRTDVDLNDNLQLAALTAYGRFRFNYGQDPDGTPFHIDELIDVGGRITAFYQEFRATGRNGRLSWLVGANYSRDRVRDRPQQFFSDNDVSRLFQQVDPLALLDRSVFEGRMRATTLALFGRMEFAASDALTFEIGARYNDDRRTFSNCGYAVTESFARAWNLFRGGVPPPTQVGDCYVLDPDNSLAPVEIVRSELDETSVSWRAGINWTPQPDLLAYVHASKGYKAGAVPVVAASTVAQFRPVKQESVLAVESGVKSTFGRNLAQINAAVFYYDYRDKQLRGATLDPTFGPLEALVSIPESHVFGAEAQLVVRPLRGLTIDTAATYVRTRIDRFTGFDGLARFGDQSGTPFPFSPRWHSVSNIDYEAGVSPGLSVFFGASLTYNSKTYAGVGARDLLRIDDHALLDLRSGVTLDGGRYRIWAWAKNVTNSYYWTNVFANANAVARFVGQPATFGVSLSGRF